MAGEDDGLSTVAPLRALVGNGMDFLTTGAQEDEVMAVRRQERRGRPLGHESFAVAVEGKLGRSLQRGKPGPKRGTAAELSMVSPEF